MVSKALAILCLLSAAASANTIAEDDEDEPEDPPTHDRLLGFRIGGGVMPYKGQDLTTASLALAVEQRVYGHWRIAGEYEYLWIGTAEDEGVDRADGNGHRASLVIRRALASSRKLAGFLRFYADLELGGGLVLATEPMTGTIAQPQAFVGLRVGYDFIELRRGTRASRVWEPELLVRAIAMPDQEVGYLFAIGMSWGD